MPNKQHCRICRRQRLFQFGLCTSCGHPASASYEPKPKDSANQLRCPSCGSSRKTEQEKGRYRCLECSGIYERPDLGYVDDRPVENAIRNEAREQRARKR